MNLHSLSFPLSFMYVSVSAHSILHLLYSAYSVSTGCSSILLNTLFCWSFNNLYFIFLQLVIDVFFAVLEFSVVLFPFIAVFISFHSFCLYLFLIFVLLYLYITSVFFFIFTVCQVFTSYFVAMILQPSWLVTLLEFCHSVQIYTKFLNLLLNTYSS